MIRTNLMKSLKKPLHGNSWYQHDRTTSVTQTEHPPKKGRSVLALCFLTILGFMQLGCQTLQPSRIAPTNSAYAAEGSENIPVGSSMQTERTPINVRVSEKPHNRDGYPKQENSMRWEIPNHVSTNNLQRPVVSDGFDSEMDLTDFQQTNSGDQRKVRPVNSVTVVSAEPIENTIQEDHSNHDLLEQLINQTVNHHPSVQAIEHQVRALRHRIAQAAALPDPTFNNVFWPIQQQALQTAAGRVGNQMSLNQKMPWPEKLRAKVHLAEKEVRIKTAELEQLKRDLTKKVKVAFYDYWLNIESSRILETTQQGLVDLLPIVEARVRSGGSQQDLLRARIAIDQIHQQLATSLEQKLIAESKLSELSGKSNILLHGEFTPPSHQILMNDFESLIETAARQNPEVLVLECKHEQAEANIQLADLQRYPDLQFGVHWGLVSDDHEVLSGVANGHDMVSFNVGTTLPIWKSKNRSAVREAKHLASSAASQLDSQRGAVVNDLRSLRATAESLLQRRSLYSQGILPKLEETLKLSLADYRGKRIDFGQLTSVYLEQLLIQTEILGIDARLGKTIAELERAIGSPILQ